MTEEQATLNPYIEGKWVTKNRLRVHDAERFTCSACFARAGDRCRVGGRRSYWPHASRWRQLRGSEVVDGAR